MNSRAMNIAIGIFLAFIIVAALLVLMLTGLKGKDDASSQSESSMAAATKMSDGKPLPEQRRTIYLQTVSMG